ncbi:type III pantothenate kinase [Muribaculaceae bacterium Isolate-104 (HZI)]|jgi:type III pantothenate kinase|nr:type III pantothenate kinase [Muribaculaceae bacterium Isolate-104 (HZI)]
MALYLTIDQGNTAAKLALWRNDALLDLLIEPSLSVDKIECFMAKHGVADAAIYCSVATPGDEIVNGITHLAHRVSRLTNATPLPIAIDYRTPCTLGTDRIAAAVGAWANHPGKNMLVVDAGTAVTYDVVSADGHFRGGNIAPGMRMRLDALHRFTKRLPQVEVPRELKYDTFMGYDTTSAMILGAIYGIVGAISYYRARLGNDTLVVMTGGWANQLSGLCDFEIVVEPDLASKGLNRILLYNETK